MLESLDNALPHSKASRPVLLQRPTQFLGCLCAATALLAAGCRPASEPPPSQKQASRVLVLGLDGMDPDAIDLLIAEGKLPHFRRLREGGAYAPLAADPPLLSPLIWTSVATGQPPSKHGIGAFTTTDASGVEVPIRSDLRRVPAIWNMASRAGRRVAAVGWWATWPAETVNGVIVSDRACYHFLQESAPEVASPMSAGPPGLVFPPTESARVLAKVRRPESVDASAAARFVDVESSEFERPFSFSDELAHFRWAIATAESYRDLGLDLWNREHPDLLLVYFEATDSVSHLFGHLFRRTDLAGELAQQQKRFGKTVERTYELADEIVGQFMAAMDDRTTLVVLSDHGFDLGRLPTDPGKLRDMRRVSERFHRPHGILYLYGRGVRAGAELRAPRILDVAPTLLTLAELPAALDMPGRVLAEGLVAPPVLERIPTWNDPTQTPATAPRADGETGPTTNGAGDRAMLEQLRALGYLGGSGMTKNDRNLAFLLLQERRYGEAAAAFKDLLARPEAEQERPDPKVRSVLLNGYASALAGKGEEASALRVFAMALEADPISSEALFNRGLVLERLGRTDEALADYRDALRYDAEFSPARRALARLGADPTSSPQTDDERRAAAHLAEAIEARKRGDYDLSERLLREACRLAPTASVYQELSNVAYLRGDREAAQQALERALALDPRNELLRHNLELLRAGSERSRSD